MISRDLLLLGCSATKLDCAGELTAIQRYDGPTYRVLRSFLREFRWPTQLSVAILSAKHGMIGSLTPIKDYDVRMTPARAEKMSVDVTHDLKGLLPAHRTVELIMGKDYLQSIKFDHLGAKQDRFHFAAGGIGYKLGRLHDVLYSLGAERRAARPVPRLDRPLYFLPDWDDFVDQDFDFVNDKFSGRRSARREVHLSALMRPQRICDGILVSLAQHLGSKGVLKRFTSLSDAIAPRSVRTHFGLADDQLAFGDCGAFSYVNEHKPTISVAQAIAFYELYDFDFGASVDHIPVEKIVQNGIPVSLSTAERRKRIRLTSENAFQFISIHRSRAARFTPVGVIQGITPVDYATAALEYCEMGYEYLALGGLVPQQDSEILDIIKSVTVALKGAKRSPWIHLLGIYRPALQPLFKEYGISSFDSATYFRKAWLRSDQNYLGAEGRWYAAIRVPPTSDARSLMRLKNSGVPEREILIREKAAFRSLHKYAEGKLSLKQCLRTVMEYDSLLKRADDSESSMEQYSRTLTDRPWEKCKCKVCKAIGIDALIFRGLNRNKRRGAHNTLQLFSSISSKTN